MMTATVTKLPSAKRAARKPAAERNASAATAKRRIISTRAAAIPMAIFGAGLALSLAHQAHGVASTTTCAEWEGWSTAVLIDCGFLAAKGLPYVAATDGQRKAVETWTKPVMIACFVLCAFFNASGYTGFIPTGAVRLAIGVVLGCFVPGVMLAMSQVARILTLGK